MKNDPVKYCDVAKQEGCAHIDSMLCNINNCSILINFRKLHYKPKLNTVAFDFDGVIHKYSRGWQDGSIYDELDYEILALIKTLLDKGHKVFIMTTRSRKQIRKHFDSFKVKIDGQTWVGSEPGMDLSYWNNPVIPFKYKTFSYRKKFWDKPGICGICNHKAVFDVLIDDRVIKYEKDKELTLDEITNFKPNV